MLRYQSFTAIYRFDHGTMMYSGTVQGLSFPFHGRSHGEMTENYHNLIDDYLSFYREIGAKPPSK